MLGFDHKRSMEGRSEASNIPFCERLREESTDCYDGPKIAKTAFQDDRDWTYINNDWRGLMNDC